MDHAIFGGVPILLVGSVVLLLIAVLYWWRVWILAHVGHLFILIIFLDAWRIGQNRLEPALLLDLDHLFDLALHDHSSVPNRLLLLFDGVLRRLGAG